MILSVSYETIDASYVEDIHKYLIKKRNIVKIRVFIMESLRVLVRVLCFFSFFWVIINYKIVIHAQSTVQGQAKNCYILLNFNTIHLSLG